MGKILDAFKKLMGAEPTEEQKKELLALEAEQEKKPNPAPLNPAPGNNAEIEALRQQLNDSNSKVDEVLKMLGDEKKAREEGIKALQQEADNKRKKEVDDLIATATGDGRIGPKDEDRIKRWRGMLEKDYETAKAELDGLPKNKAFEKPETGSGKKEEKDDKPVAGFGMSPADKNRQEIIMKAREAFAETAN